LEKKKKKKEKLGTSILATLVDTIHLAASALTKFLVFLDLTHA
jgi:hypothetical protein